MAIKNKKEMVEETKENVINAAYLFSTLNHPVEISYNGESMMIPPRAFKLKVDNVCLLGALPMGIIKKEIK